MRLKEIAVLNWGMTLAALVDADGGKTQEVVSYISSSHPLNVDSQPPSCLQSQSPFFASLV